MPRHPSNQLDVVGRESRHTATFASPDTAGFSSFKYLPSAIATGPATYLLVCSAMALPTELGCKKKFVATSREVVVADERMVK